MASLKKSAASAAKPKKPSKRLLAAQTPLETYLREINETALLTARDEHLQEVVVRLLDESMDRFGLRAAERLPKRTQTGTQCG